MSKSIAEVSLESLIKKRYQPKTKSHNVYVKIISCLSMTPEFFNSDCDREIIENPKFIEILENPLDGESHSDLFVRAIYECGKDREYFLESTRKLIEERDLQIAREIEENEQLNREIKQKEEKAGTLLENTYDSSMDDVCPFNIHDGSSFYATNPETGENELLKPHHIFQFKGHCYDIDSIYSYICKHGGEIDLDQQYIKRFFAKNGKVDFSSEGLTTDSLKKKTYHENTRTLDLSNNYITSLNGVHLPDSVAYLILDGNPLGANYFLDNAGGNVSILSMRNCGIEILDCKHLKKTIKHLDIRDNRNLTSIHSLGEMNILSKLDIRGTGIKKIDCAKFKSIGKENHKLVIYCDSGVTFKHHNQDWIKIIEG